MIRRYRALSERVETLVQVYYFALFGLVVLHDLPKGIHSGLFPVYRWPLGFLTGIESSYVRIDTTLALFVCCALAGLRPRNWAFRGLVFVSLFCFNAALHSLGATTHLYEFWLWSSFILALLPSRRIAFRYPIAWWGAQSIVLLFYGLSGFWKVVGALVQTFQGEPCFFGQKGLAYHLASEILRDGANPILKDWLLNHLALSPLIATAVVVLQLSCFGAIFRASWRRWIGVALLGFHLGTHFFLSISYPTNVLLVGILLVTTPPFMIDLPMRKRRSYPSFVWATIGCYFLFALGCGFLVPGEGELFPFFSGHWFFKVPYRMTDYGLYVTSMGEPGYVEAMFKNFKAWPFAIYGAIQEWGEAASAHSPEAEKKREFTLDLLFGKKPVRAELRLRTIDTLDFVQTHHVLHDETIEAVTR